MGLSPAFCDIFNLLVAQAHCTRFQNLVKRKIKILCDSLDLKAQKDFFNALLKYERSLTGFSYVLDYLAKQNKLELMIQDEKMPTKKDITETFLRGYILTKEKQSARALDQISRNLLHYIITPEEFKALLLPACQKAMLRSPETAIQVIPYIIKDYDLCFLAILSLHNQHRMLVGRSYHLSQFSEINK